MVTAITLMNFFISFIGSLYFNYEGLCVLFKRMGPEFFLFS
jgi:hypothetical protein